MSAWILNQCQAHWSISLSRFNFMITYRLGSQQGHLMPYQDIRILNPEKEMQHMINNILFS
jgi:hypothetical protein